MNKESGFPLGQGGFSLIELITTMGIVAILTLAAATILINFSAMFTKNVFKLEEEAVTDQVLYQVRDFAWRATMVEFAGAISLDGEMSPGGTGRVRSFNYTRFSDMSTPATTLMYFGVEDTASIPDPSGLASRFRAVGIFFQAPTPTRSGQVRIHIAPPGSSNLSSDQAQVIFEGIVGVRLFEEDFGNENLIENISFEVTSRTFMGNGPQRWCPTPDMNTGVCQTNSSWRDKAKKITLNFANNRRFTPRIDFKYPYGSYFFKAN